ncbi:MAG: 23S rRNA (adenine1618-N6)-methyltransferase [Gammaproteobacteria bacterium]|jgi:23S rRNA (adenine1618-N6)-methyltransferase
MVKHNHSSTGDIAKLHPRNPHKGRYDLALLSRHFPDIKQFIVLKEDGGETLDFGNPAAVLALNQSLLATFYNVSLWQIPAGYLCPPIPGRADYIHHIADLMADASAHAGSGLVPTGRQVSVLDIGTGANCIYPIVGSQAYGWTFVGTDIDPVSVKCAQNIARSNPSLRKNIKVLRQKNSDLIFEGVIGSGDLYDLTMCNPPFHSSMEEATASNQRKQNNLNKHRKQRAATHPGPFPGSQNRSPSKEHRNFGGQKNELWCAGGEIAFLQKMVKESQLFAEQVCWFTTLVSKSENVQPLKVQLEKLGVERIEVLNMSQGQKTSRVLVWSFLSRKQQREWARHRWSSV